MELFDLVGTYSGQGFAGLIAGVSAWLTTRSGLGKAVREAVRKEVAPLRAELNVLNDRVEALELNGRRARLSISRPVPAPDEEGE